MKVQLIQYASTLAPSIYLSIYPYQLESHLKVLNNHFGAPF